MAVPVQSSLVILTGPPGAGKTTVARILADTADRPMVHLHTDDFFSAIRTGFVPPWLPESRVQNGVISGAIAAAAGAFTEGGYAVIVDGIVGPWHLDAYRNEAQRLGIALDYVVLRLERDLAVARARGREVTPLSDYPPHIFEGLSDLGPLESHALEIGTMTAGAVAGAVKRGLAEGRFQLS